jgi:hypothetical protein
LNSFENAFFRKDLSHFISSFISLPRSSNMDEFKNLLTKLKSTKSKDEGDNLITQMKV